MILVLLVLVSICNESLFLELFLLLCLLTCGKFLLLPTVGHPLINLSPLIANPLTSLVLPLSAHPHNISLSANCYLVNFTDTKGDVRYKFRLLPLRSENHANTT